MTCTINRSHPWSGRSFNASELRFNVSGHIVMSAPFVRVLNETTAALSYRVVHYPHHLSYVDCLVQLNATTTVVIAWEQINVACKYILACRF